MNQPAYLSLQLLQQSQVRQFNKQHLSLSLLLQCQQR
jgi:hypothetical protein